MTWIVAKQIFFGYITLLSDVQVTWRRNNRVLRKDCLKKVYPIHRNVVAGFSGSVDIGFYLLDDLSKYIFHLEQKGKDILPRKIAQNWYRRARRIFNQFPESHRNNGCSILMAGISSSETFGDTKIPRNDIIIFKHNNLFQPKYVDFLKTASIGSGNNVQAYIEFLDGMDEAKNMHSLLAGEPVSGIAGGNMALVASIIMQNNQAPGISKHVHCTQIGNMGIKQFPINYSTYDNDGNIIETTMPNVAESYSEFKNLEKSVYGGVGLGCA